MWNTIQLGKTYNNSFIRATMQIHLEGNIMIVDNRVESSQTAWRKWIRRLTYSCRCFYYKNTFIDKLPSLNIIAKCLEWYSCLFVFKRILRCIDLQWNGIGGVRIGFISKDRYQTKQIGIFMKRYNHRLYTSKILILSYYGNDTYVSISKPKYHDDKHWR